MALASSAASFQQRFFSGARFDAAVPDYRQVHGVDFGEQISMSYEVLAFARQLAAASPRVHLEVHGHSLQKRPMALLFVSSETNIAKLQQLQADYQALADPRTLEKARLDQLVQKLPALVWFLESVHGDEPSGSDAGLFTAWYLAAGQDDAVAALRDKTVVVFELMQNPDGRDRFVHFSRDTRPVGGDAESQGAHKQESWPSGRLNHYLFDLNRDWFPQSQIETRFKVDAYLKWFPHITIDRHEMGGESSFFAAFPSPPVNPLLPSEMTEAYRDLGQAIGKDFDARRWDYFQGEIFDSFYPGYGETWPSLHGSVGILFEQGGTSGLKYRRKDGVLVTYADAVAHQSVAGLAVIRHAAENRDAVLRFFHDRRRGAIDYRDETEVRRVFLLPGDDPTRLAALGTLLERQGIEVQQLSEDVRNAVVKKRSKGPNRKQDLPAGSLLVDFAQPAGLLARTLLMDNVELDPAFLERQRDRFRHQRQGAKIYDITAWSLPFVFGVEPRYSLGRWEGAARALTKPAAAAPQNAELAYLIPRNFVTPRLSVDLLRAGLKLRVTGKAIRRQDTTFGAGSLIVKVADQPGDTDVAKVVYQTCGRFGVTPTPIASSWFDEGPALGSRQVKPLPTPKVALLWDAPAGQLSAGWLRFYFEQDLGITPTLFRAGQMASADLREFDVVFIPSGSASTWLDRLGKEGVANLKTWVAAGGVLAALGASCAFLAHQEVGLLASASEYRDGLVETDQATSHPKLPEDDPEDMVLPRRERPQKAYGALVNVAFDTSHWLAYGMPAQQAVLVESNRIMRPLRLDQGRNVGRYLGREELVVSGYVPEATGLQLAHKPYAMVAKHARGVVVALCEAPYYRGFTQSTAHLLYNTAFLGPVLGR
ncbi:M14 family zinc carboxypeptidase [Acanthopleuribacter pedis]|uniref:Peptidase M14 domain-containing protein n=1 Tax=Acanthopleuribacter pedis TaxID=442870 RepID=A0A8J7Q0Q2_9BACT|nr:M14 family zinc carboxypeptidase [Acanthopleuribacter pedis]MBO1318262.1 hypothetical protein [Acanthopleuribacter pedis]